MLHINTGVPGNETSHSYTGIGQGISPEGADISGRAREHDGLHIEQWPYRIHWSTYYVGIVFTSPWLSFMSPEPLRTMLHTTPSDGSSGNAGCGKRRGGSRGWAKRRDYHCSYPHPLHGIRRRGLGGGQRFLLFLSFVSYLRLVSFTVLHLWCVSHPLGKGLGGGKG